MIVVITDNDQKQLSRVNRFMLQQIFWNVVSASQANPPRCTEVVMLSVAIVLLGVWGRTEQWPYLVLSLSYVIGSSVSVLVRETCFPSSQAPLTKITAVLLLGLSVCGFLDLARYYY